MRPNTRLLRWVLTPIAVIGAGCARTEPRREPPPVAVSWPAHDPSIRDRDIAFFAERIRLDPSSAIDRSRLAAQYLARSRERGSVADVDSGEALAAASLALRGAHNTGTYSLLASARLAKHDFVGALAAARRYVAADTAKPVARALLGEILLEIGKYDEARAIFASLEPQAGPLSVASRLVRFYEVTGQLERARSVARYVARRAESEALSREEAAWYQMRVGDLATKRGDFAEADSAYSRGLAIWPADHRVLAAQARLAFARRDWRRAIASGEAAIVTQPDPGTLGILADAYRAIGDTAQAMSYAAAMTASALTQPGPIHRAWGLYLVDHGERATDVLRRVRRELRTRRDVYGYDLLAWTLHALGRNREAWDAMQRAQSQGTEDAQIAWHAAVIAAAVGDTTAARRQQQRVIVTNPQFLPPLTVPARMLAH